MASSLIGVAALTRQLQQLGNRAQTGSAIRAAAREAMKPAQEKARANAPVGTREHKSYKGRTLKPGFTKRSVRIVTNLSRDKTRATALLGVRAEAFYALQFIELGTAKIPASPWLVPAFEQSQDEAMQAIGASLRKRIDQIAAKRK